jgi:hypothetical protein
VIRARAVKQAIRKKGSGSTLEEESGAVKDQWVNHWDGEKRITVILLELCSNNPLEPN